MKRTVQVIEHYNQGSGGNLENESVECRCVLRVLHVPFCVRPTLELNPSLQLKRQTLYTTRPSELLVTSYDLSNWPYKSKELRLDGESVAPWRRSSVGWMPERTGR